jgi:hypothetical protein
MPPFTPRKTKSPFVCLRRLFLTLKDKIKDELYGWTERQFPALWSTMLRWSNWSGERSGTIASG